MTCRCRVKPWWNSPFDWLDDAGMQDGAPHLDTDAPVSRARYEREKRARHEAEMLLETKSRELYEANERLRMQAETLEQTVRQRTADLEAARAQADAANAAKSVFLTIISHEIRTPMNGILGMAAALAETSLQDQQMDMLSIITEFGGALVGVLDDVLDLSKIEAGLVDLENTPFDLTGIFDSFEHLLRPKAQEKGLQLSMQQFCEGWYLGDARRLRQVLGNLLTNAIKFTEYGSIDVVIDTEAGDDGGLILKMVVTDTGIGMSEEARDQIFSPYLHSRLETMRLRGGTGLGLPISRDLCQRMGGDLTLRSHQGVGSTFTATARIRPTEKPRVFDPADALHAFADLLARRRLTVIAAEDNPTDQMVLAAMLRPFDLSLSFVSNGLEVVDAWRNDEPDLILMDIQMPLMSGLDAAAAIRRAEVAQTDRRHTPIVAMSTTAMRHRLDEHVNEGIECTIAKPFNRQELVSAMLSVLDADNP